MMSHLWNLRKLSSLIQIMQLPTISLDMSGLMTVITYNSSSARFPNVTSRTIIFVLLFSEFTFILNYKSTVYLDWWICRWEIFCVTYLGKSILQREYLMARQNLKFGGIILKGRQARKPITTIFSC